MFVGECLQRTEKRQVNKLFSKSRAIGERSEFEFTPTETAVGYGSYESTTHQAIVISGRLGPRPRLENDDAILVLQGHQRRHKIHDAFSDPPENVAGLHQKIAIKVSGPDL